MKFLACLCIVLTSVSGQVRFHEHFFRGRPRDGFLPPVPSEVVERIKSDRGIQTLWFTQRLDHFGFGAPHSTWKQRYQTNNKYYRPGGPLFVMIGGEGPLSGFIDYGDWVKNGRLYGAYLLVLEHRYYGLSRPTPDASTANLRWLSSEQALADLANFITTMKTQLGMQNAKVIVFGGSYSGNLAAWFRLKYPQVADGAVGSSAPVWAKADFYEYLEVVKTSLDYISPGCSNNVQQAFNQLTSVVTSGTTSSLTQMFGLCSPLDPSQTMDLGMFYESLIGTFQTAVQYNRMGPTSRVKSLCEIMSNPNLGNLLQRLAYIFNPHPNQPVNPSNCIDFKYQDLIKWITQTNWNSSAAGGGGRTWFYQTCTEFGYYQTTDSSNQPFGKHMTLAFEEQLCKDTFGISPQTISSAIQQTNNFYGARNLKTTNVVLPNGSVDPWHALGILTTLGPTEVAQYYMGGSHCYDMMQPNQYDSQALKNVRVAITGLIGRFLSSS